MNNNEKGEAELREVVLKVASQLYTPGANVLDLGCGYGRTAASFVNAGFSYTGVDVSPDAIQVARLTVSAANFIQADLQVWEPQCQYDVVSVFYVFVHFVDDSAWYAFVEKCLSSVRSGGIVWIADVFPDERNGAVHFVSRPLSEYASLFNNYGFAIDEAFRTKVTAENTSSCTNHFVFARKMAKR